MRDPDDPLLLKLEMAKRVLKFSYENPDDDLNWIHTVERLQVLVDRAEELLWQKAEGEPPVH